MPRSGLNDPGGMIAVIGVDRLLQQIGHGVYSSLMTSNDFGQRSTALISRQHFGLSLCGTSRPISVCVLEGPSVSLRVIANLVLAVVLGSFTAQAQETRLGQTSRATIMLAQAWWTVAGQTGAQQQQQQQQQQPFAPSRHSRRRR